MYTFFAYAILPFVLIRLIYRGTKQTEYLKNISERLGYYQKEKNYKAVFWLHAVSVGETYAAEPLIKEILKRHPKKDILITTTTPTGRRTAKKIFPEKVIVTYLPYDIPFAINRFLRNFNPGVGILMETEIWPNLIKLCKKNKIPLHLINARLSKKSARGYAKLSIIFRNTIKSLDIIAAQSRNDAKRLQFFRKKPVVVTGNLKFDRVISEEQKAQGKFLKEKFQVNRPIFLAASTRPGEEEILIESIFNLRCIPKLLTVIVPRHPNRCDSIATFLQGKNVIYQYLSKVKKINEDAEVALGDELGNLFAHYYSCDIAFVGGSLLPYGGHNFLEACVLGKPVILGPFTFNFDKFAKQAIKANAARRIQDAKNLSATVEYLVADNNARQKMGLAGINFIKSMQGATQRNLELLKLE